MESVWWAFRDFTKERQNLRAKDFGHIAEEMRRQSLRVKWLWNSYQMDTD